MKRMSRYAMPCRLLGLLLCALLLAGMLPSFGALGAPKKNNTGSLKVSLGTNIDVIPKETRDIEFTLYKVGTPDQDTALGWRFDNDNSLSPYTNGIVEIIKAKRNSELQMAVNQLAKAITDDYELSFKYQVDTLDLSSGSAVAPNLGQGIYIGVLTNAPVGLYASSFLFTIPFWNADKTKLLYDADIVVKDTYYYDSVAVFKVDSEDKSTIEGAEFTLYHGDTPVNHYVSNKDGNITISTNEPKLESYLPKSDAERVVLILKETHAPRGYILPRNDAYKVVITRKTVIADDISVNPIVTYNITIGAGNGKKIQTIKNYPQNELVYTHHSLTINKVDNENRPLNGAVFTLYYNNRAITTYSGGEFNISTKDKPLQRYLPEPGKKITLKLRETRAPSGYKRSDTEYDVVISAAITSKSWNEDHSKLINGVDYAITINSKNTLTVVNEPEPEPEPEPPAGGGGGGGVPQEPNPPIDITVTKNWVDDGNFNQVRPGAIDITLYADGSPVSAQPTWTRSGDSWTATFTNLPSVDSSGNKITYTVDESPVEFYSKDVSGLTITNTLEDRPPQEYVDLSVTKIWQDNGNIEERRPTNITIHLYRDGTLIETVHVTPGTDWLYTFKNLPADNGYGHVYEYTIDEDTVPGYYKRVNGLEITNGMLPPGGDIPNQPDQPDRPREIPERGGTPAPVFEDLSDEELEELFDMFGYGTPLYGMLGTGDQVPMWVWICGGVGIIALAMAILMGRKKRKQQ